MSLSPPRREDQAGWEAGCGGAIPKGPSGGQTKSRYFDCDRLSNSRGLMLDLGMWSMSALAPRLSLMRRPSTQRVADPAAARPLIGISTSEVRVAPRLPHTPQADPPRPEMALGLSLLARDRRRRWRAGRPATGRHRWHRAAAESARWRVPVRRARPRSRGLRSPGAPAARAHLARARHVRARARRATPTRRRSAAGDLPWDADAERRARRHAAPARRRPPAGVQPCEHADPRGWTSLRTAACAPCSAWSGSRSTHSITRRSQTLGHGLRAVAWAPDGVSRPSRAPAPASSSACSGTPRA